MASGAVNPFRLDRSQAATADQEHDYTAEQLAFHAGLMDLFPKSVGRGNPSDGSVLSFEYDGTHHGLFRREHGHRNVELCAAFLL